MKELFFEMREREINEAVLEDRPFYYEELQEE